MTTTRPDKFHLRKGTEFAFPSGTFVHVECNHEYIGVFENHTVTDRTLLFDEHGEPKETSCLICCEWRNGAPTKKSQERQRRERATSNR